MQLWKGYDLQWTREESLSDLQAVQFVDLPEKSLFEDTGAVARLQATLRKAVVLGETIVDASKVRC